jgi:uncharacterized protein (DUF1501 family)
MISIPSFAPSASKPHDKAAKREQNPHYTRYNGLKGLLCDHLRVDERVLAAEIFPGSDAIAPMSGLLA